MFCMSQRFRQVNGRCFGVLAVLLCAGTGRADQTPLEITNLWAFHLVPKLSSPHYDTSSTCPAVAPDGSIYVAAFDGTLFAVTPKGKEKWQFKTKLEIHSSPAIAADGTVYFGSRDRKLYAVTPAGHQKWCFASGAWVDSSPAIAADGTVYFGSWDKNFYALNPDGSLKWKCATGAVIESSPAIGADGTIYFGSHDKKFYALAPDGKVRWTFLTGGVISSSPAIGSNGTLYFSSLDGNLYALNPDGTKQWQVHTGAAGDGSPVVDEQGHIYLAVNTYTSSFTSDGKHAWDWPSATELDVPPAAVTGQVYISRPWLLLHGLSLDGKTNVWSATLPANLSSAPVVGPDGMVYASCNFHLCAIRPPNLLPPAKSSWPMFRANARHTGRVGDQ